MRTAKALLRARYKTSFTKLHSSSFIVVNVSKVLLLLPANSFSSVKYMFPLEDLYFGTIPALR